MKDRTIQGDCLANGLTVLPWREKLLAFSQPTFITQVWLIAAADSPLHPITPSGDLGHDIQSTKKQLAGQSLMGRAGTCLDPGLYGLEKAGADIKMFSESLNELAPAVIQDEAELTLLDVPDALVALQKWPGQIKVLGPISEIQYMGVAFRKQDQGLRQAFNQFFKQCREDGTYRRLVNEYYPGVTEYFPDFFSSEK
ncbi:MAG: transporter substrate-binding domain-containing protein [Desulfohalobiaceae bacterium]|nr:transporter substrate-binding domain-containing protein [Desulfohalobiaceae bacterium]